MDSILIITTWIIVFWLGWRVGTNIQGKVFADVLRKLGVGKHQLDSLRSEMARDLRADTKALFVNPANPDDPVDNSNDEFLELAAKVECHDNCLYAYALADGRFLAQGKDRASLIARLNETMENVKLVIADEHGAEHVREQQ
jgi:hypothetical protein